MCMPGAEEHTYTFLLLMEHSSSMHGHSRNAFHDQTHSCRLTKYSPDTCTNVWSQMRIGTAVGKREHKCLEYSMGLRAVSCWRPAGCLPMCLSDGAPSHRTPCPMAIRVLLRVPTQRVLARKLADLQVQSRGRPRNCAGVVCWQSAFYAAAYLTFQRCKPLCFRLCCVTAPCS